MTDFLTWRKDVTGIAIATVTPGALVRVQVPGVMPSSDRIDVFLVPDGIFKRVLSNIPGFQPDPHVQLDLDASAPGQRGGGLLSEPWPADHPHLGPEISRFVARSEKYPRSLLLNVQPTVSLDRKGGSVGGTLDPAAAITAVTGVPLPSPLKIDARSRSTSMSWGIAAPEDPALKLRILTPSGSGRESVRAYVQSYVPRAASLHAPGQEGRFERAFYEEYAEHLRDTAQVGAEASLDEIELGAGESADFDVRLYPHAAGKTMIAVAAIDQKTDELVAISELVGLTLSPNGGTVDW